jgi:hypothetical protein
VHARSRPFFFFIGGWWWWLALAALACWLVLVAELMLL